MNATSVAGPGSQRRLRARRGTWHRPARAGGGRGPRSGPPRQSHSLCDTAGARGWLRSWMTQPQRSPETLAGSFAKQVLSLVASELGAGSTPATVELLERPLLAAPRCGADWGPPPSLAQG